jgi:O-antigen ligase
LWGTASLSITFLIVFFTATQTSVAFWAAAVVIFGVAAVLMLKWPDLTTIIAIGLIYSNVSVVAVRFHGLPSILPAATLGILAWPFIYRLVIQKENLLIPPAAPYLLCFIFIQFTSAILSKDPRYSFGSFMSFLLEGAVVYALVSNIVRTRRLVIACFWMLALCAVLMGGIPMLKQLSGNADSIYGGFAQAGSDFNTGTEGQQRVISQQRATGSIGEQNRYGQFMILLAPITLSLLSISSKTRLKCCALVASLFSLVGFALAFSRGAAVGLVLGIGVATLLNLLSRKQLKWFAIGGIVVLLLLPQYLDRLSSITNLTTLSSPQGASSQTDGAIRGRLTEMAGAALAFRDHPILGVGPGMFVKYSQQYSQVIGLRSLGSEREAHSLPLDIMAETGILGSICFTAMLLAVFTALTSKRRIALKQKDTVGAALAGGITVALILYLTTGLFLHLSYIRYFWLLIGLADAISMLTADGDRGDDFLPRLQQDS